MAANTANSFNSSTVGYPQSGLLATNDLVRPDFQETLFDQYGDQFLKEFRLIKAMNSFKPTQNSAGGFLFENNRYDVPVEVQDDDGTATTTLVFKVATSMINSSNGQRSIYPVVGQILRDMSDGNIGRITDISDDGTDFTITAVSQISENWTVPTAGKKYALIYNTQFENSVAPNPQESFWTKKTYTLAAMRTTAAVTDFAAANRLYPSYDQQGNYVGNWGGVVEVQNEFRHIKSQIGACILGQVTTASGQPTATQGMMDAFATGANPVDVSSGTMIDHYKTMVDMLKENSPMSNNYMVWICRNLINDINDDLQVDTENANIVRVTNESSRYIFGTNEPTPGMMTKFDFQTIILNGFTFNNRLFDMSYDPQAFGLNADIDGNDFANTAYFMQSKAGTDAQGNLTRNLTVRYLDFPGGPQSGTSIKVWRDGAMANPPIGSQMNLRTMYYSSWGNQWYNLAQCGYFHKAPVS